MNIPFFMLKRTIAKSFLLLVLLVFTVSYLKAQINAANTDDLNNLRNVIAPSPNAAALGKYAEWPVNLNTGIPSINIPLFEVKGRTLSVPISLDYHASGIKIGEIASWVGLGWSLQAGGVITRSVRGLPDECTLTGYFYNRKQFPDYNYTFEQSPNPSILWKGMVMDQAINETDGVPDLYYFNALGRSYKFLFLESPTTGRTIQTIPYSNVLVTTSFDQEAGDDTWTVTLEDGTKLVFGGTGFTEVTNNPRNRSVCGSSFTSSWYLQSITSPLGEKINFTYTNTSDVSITNYFSMDDMVGWESVHGAYIGGTAMSYNKKLEIQTINVLQLDEIRSDIYSVKFNPSQTDRIDLPGTKALSSITLRSLSSNGAMVSIDDFQLMTHQELADGGNEYPVDGADYMHWRLMLDGVKHRGIHNAINFQQWSFGYSSVKLPSALSYAQDYYGYYNGANSNSSILPKVDVVSPFNSSSSAHGFFPPDHPLGDDRSLNAATMTAGMLTKITFPTGGASTFTYEPNQYSKSSSQYSDATISLDLDVNSNSTVRSVSQSFDVTMGHTAHLTFTSAIPNMDAPGVRTQVEVTGPAPLFPDRSVIAILGSGDQYFNLDQIGTYTIRMSTNAMPGSFSTPDQTITMSADLTYSKSVGSDLITILLGGVRVSKIVDSDGIDTSRDIIRNFIYSFPKKLNPVDPANDYVTELDEFALGARRVKFFRNSSTKFALGSAGATVAYNKVITRYGSNGQNGYTQTLFRDRSDVNDSGSPPNQAPYADVDTREYERGLIASEINFDASGNKVKGMYSTYEFIPKGKITFFKSYRQYYYNDPSFCADPQMFCDYFIIRETLSSEQINKTSTRHTLYKKVGDLYDSVSTLTSYNFDNTTASTKPLEIVTTDSRGVEEKQTQHTVFRRKEIIDYIKGLNLPISELDSVEAIASLKVMTTANQVGTVIQQVKSVGGTSIETQLVNYKRYTGTPQPILPANVIVQAGTNTAENRVRFTQYDSKWNLLEQQKSADVKHNYIYDYNQQYPIAEVVNADAGNSFGYTSFEAEGTGNWALSSIARDGVNFYTGNASYMLGAGVTISKTGLPSAKYKISFWAKNGSNVTVNTASLTGLDTRNGWTYYETTLTTTSISIAGSGNIDELRFYPVQSQMTTYTFNPGVGVTSITDTKNQSLFYVYDSLNRLQLIKDDKGNIVKTYEYNYQLR
jgi:hypothetical protein